MEDSLFNILVIVLSILSVAASVANSMKKKREKQRGDIGGDAAAEETEWEIPSASRQFPFGRPFVTEASPEPASDSVTGAEAHATPFATREEDIEVRPCAARKATMHSEVCTPHTSCETEGAQVRSETTAAFDLKQAVIWSEILKPKFDER